MAAYTDSIGFDKNSAAFVANGSDRLSFASVKLDFAAIKAARLAAGATALAANDTLQIVPVPAGALVIAGSIKVVTAEVTNTTATLDLGFTGGDVDVFVDGVTTNVAGLYSTALVIGAANFVAADDTVDLLFLTAVPVDAVIKVNVAYYNLA